MRNLSGFALGIIVATQLFISAPCEESVCKPGFTSDQFIFQVGRIHVNKGRRLGRVTFDDCSGRQRFAFSSEDSRFKVDTDGTVYVKRAVTLHDGHKSFSVHAWDSNGKKITSTVRIQHEITSKQESVTPEQLENSQPLLVLEFPKSSAGVKRRKREWVISPMQNEPAETPAVQQFPKVTGNLIRKKRDWETPPLSVPENQIGPFPKPVWKLHSSKEKEVKIVYSITGPGADQDPKGVFIIDAVTGLISVTRMLDREKQDQYELTGHATTANGQPAESPNKITISVTDQNDNKPIFTQDTFEGSLPEASPKDTVVLQVTATDADDPSTTNAELRYSIVSQDPTLPNGQMFAIDSISGKIQLSSAGLDKEKYPRYTLTVTAADLAGEGFSTSCKVIIKVKDRNTPQFTQPVYNASVRENIVNAEVVTLTVTDADDADTPVWFAKYKIIQGDDGGFFNINTAPNRQDGIITTVKPLDFEKKNKYTLLVTAENKIPFVRGVETATATVVVNVEDVNVICREEPEPRMKGWVISSINIAGNDRGPFPKKILKIKSKTVRNFNREYSITWPGAESDAHSLFSIDKTTGWIYVEQALDSKKRDQYAITVTVTTPDNVLVEEELEIILTVTN